MNFFKNLRRSHGHSGSKETLFDKLNRNVHDRIIIKVGNPALTCHRGFWKPDKLNDLKWHAEVARYVRDTKTRVDAAFGGCVVRQVPPQSKKTAQMRPGESTMIEVKCGDLLISLIFELFDEFFSQMVVIDYSAVSDVGESGFAVSDTAVRTHLAAIHRSLVDVESAIADRFTEAYRQRELRRPIEQPSDDANDPVMQNASRDISLAWQALYTMLFPKGRIVGNEILYADFVGFSLGMDISEYNCGRMQSVGKEKRDGAPEQERRATRLPITTAKSIGKNIRPEHRFESPQVLAALAGAVWSAAVHLNPFYVTDQATFENSPGAFRTSWRDHSFSTINRNRSLYTTSMGGARPDRAHGVRYPLSYILLSPHRARWQIGRITDRIHSLGLLRLAVLREFDDIHATNDEVREAIRRLENRRSFRIHWTERQFRKTCSARFGREGFHYRLQWANHYLGLFLDTARNLEFGRIEGYQTYDEFVRKKLGQKFAAIDGATKRLAYAEDLIATKTSLRNGNFTMFLTFLAVVFGALAALGTLYSEVTLVWAVAQIEKILAYARVVG